MIGLVIELICTAVLLVLWMAAAAVTVITRDTQKVTVLLWASVIPAAIGLGIDVLVLVGVWCV